MSDSQLTASERDRFYELSTTTDLSLRAIAKELGRNPSTISRELARNQGERGVYLPDRAQQQMKQRRKQAKTEFSGITERIGIEQRHAIADAKVEIGHW